MREIVRREGDRDAIAKDHADAVFAHATAELGPDYRTGVGLNFELPASEHVGDYAVELHMIVATQRRLLEERPQDLRGV